jgi:hypothetical protein
MIARRGCDNVVVETTGSSVSDGRRRDGAEAETTKVHRRDHGNIKESGVNERVRWKTSCHISDSVDDNLVERRRSADPWISARSALCHICRCLPSAVRQFIILVSA